MSQFGILLKSTDPAHPDDEQRIPVAADGIAAAAEFAESLARGTKWRVHQVTDLERG